MVGEGKTTVKEAGEVMRISYRYGKRLKKKFILEGARGLVHGNRGRPSPRAVNREFAEPIIVPSFTAYKTFSDTHFTEMIHQREKIKWKKWKNVLTIGYLSVN